MGHKRRTNAQIGHRSGPEPALANNLKGEDPPVSGILALGLAWN